MKPLQLFILFFIALFLGSCVPKERLKVPEPAQEIKVAMIVPDKIIGRYAYSTPTAVFAYFLTRNRPFVLTGFPVADESPKEMKRVLSEIKAKAFRYVIAPLTPVGAGFIVDNETELNVFFPTVNKIDFINADENIYFGAIDYKAQIEKLIPLASSPLVIMHDKSAQGKKLLRLTKESYLQSSRPFLPTSRRELSLLEGTPYQADLEPKNKKVIAYGVEKKSANLQYRFEKNEEIRFGSFFLDTPLIKSVRILSQLTLHDVKVTNVLSTQINYDPLLLSMTQKRDRENLYIANSVSVHNETLSEINALLNNDIVYDWINYASTVGADYFYHMITDSDRIYRLPMVDNQIIYPVSIVQPYDSRFKVMDEL